MIESLDTHLLLKSLLFDIHMNNSLLTQLSLQFTEK